MTQGFRIGLVRGHGYEVDSVSVTTLSKVFPENSQVFEIGLTKVVGIDGVFPLGLFEAIETSPLTEGKVEFVGVPNLKDKNVVLGVAKMSLAFHQGFDFGETVGYDYDQSSSFELGYQFVKDCAEVGLSSWFRFFQNPNQVTDVSGSSPWR